LRVIERGVSIGGSADDQKRTGQLRDVIDRFQISGPDAQAWSKLKKQQRCPQSSQRSQSHFQPIDDRSVDGWINGFQHRGFRVERRRCEQGSRAPERDADHSDRTTGHTGMKILDGGEYIETLSPPERDRLPFALAGCLKIDQERRISRLAKKLGAPYH
jgi:hypothetical protein